MATRYTEGESPLLGTTDLHDLHDLNDPSSTFDLTSNPYTELQVTETEAPPVLPKCRTFLLNATQFGLNFMVLLLSVEIVPAQVEKMVGGASKGRTLGGLVAGGAAVTFIVSPLVGMISDRITSRMGKRRPMMLVGTVILCVGLIGMALSAPEINSQHKAQNPLTSIGNISSLLRDNHTTQSEEVNHKCNIDLEERRCRQYLKHSSSSSSVVAAGSNAKQSTSVPGTNANSTLLYQPEDTFIGGSLIKHALVDAVDQGLQASVGHAVGHPQGVMLPRFKSQGPAEVEEELEGNLALYIVFFLMVISSQASIAVPFNALVADKSHPSQRGFNSGVMGAMILFGNVCGAVAGIGLTRIGVLGMYAIIIGQLVVCIVITTFSVTEAVSVNNRKAEPISFKLIFVGFWAPLKEHDFRWVFITRFLMQQGVATITGFLEYWLHDMIHLPNCLAATTAVAILLLPLLGAASISSIIFGIVSDKTGYRKIIVTIASFMMGLGSFINAFLSGDYAFYTAAIVSFVIGLGFGAFQSVDFALVMDVLGEDNSDKAAHIAVWHQSLVLPQALATPTGGLVLDFFQKVNCHIGLGYMILFLLTSFYAFLSGILVYKIRRAR